MPDITLSVIIGGILFYIVAGIVLWIMNSPKKSKPVLQHKPAHIISSYFKKGHSHIIVEASHFSVIERELNIPSGALIISKGHNQYDIDLDANGSLKMNKQTFDFWSVYLGSLIIGAGIMIFTPKVTKLEVVCVFAGASVIGFVWQMIRFTRRAK